MAIDNQNWRKYGHRDKKLIIPEGVEKIGCYEFDENEFIEEIIFPSTLKSISSGAFIGCANLKQVILPEGVEEIEFEAFSGCANLQSITIPGTVKSIGFSAFSGCANLQSITIPGTVKSIGFSAFSGCANLKQVILPEGVEEIEFEAFSGCTNLQSVTIPGTVKSIGDDVFSGCANLKQVILLEGIEEIARNAFSGCTNLQSVTIPGTVKSIGSYAFSGCTNLQSVTIPGTVKSIGSYAFSGCANLKQVILPEGIERINWSVFSGCTNLQSVTIPGTVKSIGDSAFRGCANLKQVILPEGIEEIGGHAFSLCENLQSITIPGIIKSIREFAFFWCTNLEQVILSEGVEEIGEYAFYECENISKIEFSPNLITIGTGAFSVTNNKSQMDCIELPKSVKQIGKNAFKGRKIDKLQLNEDSDHIKDKSFSDYDKSVVDFPKSIKGFAGGTFGKKSKSLIWSNGSIQELRLLAIDIIEKKEYISEQKKNVEAMQIKLKNMEIEYAKKFMENHKEFSMIQGLENDHSTNKNQIDEQSNIDNLYSKLECLKEHRKKTFFLSFSKKKAIDELIDSTLKELQIRKNKLSAEKEIKIITDQIEQIEDEIPKCEKQIAEKELKWEVFLEIVKEKQFFVQLSEEKSSIITNMQKPSPSLVVAPEYKLSNGIIEESLINDAYANAVELWNEINKADSHNKFIAENKHNIERIEIINSLLGCEIDDKIEQFKLIDSKFDRSLSSCLPERFKKLNEMFAKSDSWKSLKTNAKFISCKKSKKDINNMFFSPCDYVPLECNKNRILLFPYCIVILEEKSSMQVFTYNEVKATVSYDDRKEEQYKATKNGEVISEQYKYVNIDGSKNRRYKDNPLIKTVRYSHITLSIDKKRYILQTNSYDNAIIFSNAFNEQVESFSNGLHKEIYSCILKSQSMENIDSLIEKHKEIEKEKLINEKKAKEELKKKFEQEQLIAKEKEEKRKLEIIQRQKKINEEIKKQKLANEKLTQFFEGDDQDFDSKTIEIISSQDLSKIPFKVIGNHLVSNNIFKITFEQLLNLDKEDIVLYFTDMEGNIISNKRKLIANDIGAQTVVGFVLNAGIDYTKMLKCLLKFESPSTEFDDIDFDISISFYSDF